MQLRRLVLPAPFGPTIAWIVPGSTARLTSESALTPRKLSMIPVASSRATEPRASVGASDGGKEAFDAQAERRIFCAETGSRTAGSSRRNQVARIATFLAANAPLELIRRPLLAWRPAERAAAHDVEVDVEDELVRVPVHVQRRAPARVRDPALLRELRRDAEQLPRERVVLRVEVLESHDVRVLMDELRGDLPLDDLAEQAVRHVVLHEGAQDPRLR